MRTKTFLLLLLFILILIIEQKTIGKPSKTIDVPYINQKYDVPEWFDGRYSCGPASVAMVLAYYGVLPKWPMNISKPFIHTNNFGRYICCIFKVKDKVFNEKSLDASRYAFGYGIHGYVYIPGKGASWNRMVELFRIFGFESYVETNVSWDILTHELDSGRPVILSTQLTSSGHIVVAVGYYNNHSVIVNDPAGNRNLGSYFNYYGKTAIYDWPGYNNGHVNLNKVKAFIIVKPRNLNIAIPLECRVETIKQATSHYLIVSIVAISLLAIILGLLLRYKNLRDR
ncbi:MAG: C39 family peptidase [Thermoproteales archaeon]|nr:C39 family peptidase [Thermoproteales archaeon]